MNNQPAQSLEFSQALKKFIVILKQEKLDSNILQFQKELFSRLYKQVTQQENLIKDFVKQNQQDSFESSVHLKNLKQQIYKCQTEKINYLLKEYLRIRLKKIQKYCFYLYKNQNIAKKQLSDNEYIFMSSFAEMKYKYFQETVLKHMIKAFRGLGGLQSFFSKTSQIKSQVDSKQSRLQICEPTNNNYVFCQILANPDLYRFNSDIPMDGMQQKSVIPVGSTIYTQYKYVSKLISDSNGVLL